MDKSNEDILATDKTIYTGTTYVPRTKDLRNKYAVDPGTLDNSNSKIGMHTQYLQTQNSNFGTK